MGHCIGAGNDFNNLEFKVEHVVYISTLNVKSHTGQNAESLLLTPEQRRAEAEEVNQPSILLGGLWFRWHRTLLVSRMPSFSTILGCASF